MNLMQLAGFLGADAEERFTSTGKKIIYLRMATKVRHNGKDETNWWRIKIWGDRFDKMIPYLKKGTPLIVIGEMGKPEIYTDKSGTTQVSLTVTADMIKFSPFGKLEKPGEMAPAAASQAPADPFGNTMGEEMAGYGATTKGSAHFDDPFAGDDLPF